jgi:hypothetical protein
MATQTQENQEIEQAIARLSQKMRTVSDAMELARTPVRKTAANQNKAKNGKKRRFSLGKFFKSLLLLSLFAGLSYMLASLVAVYIEQVKTKQTQEIATPAAPLAPAPAPAIATTPAAKTDTPVATATTPAGQLAPAGTSQPAQEKASAPLPLLTPSIIDSPTPSAPPPAPTAPAIADFALKSANYQIVDTELGRALDIFITVINRGDGVGRPRLFEIELINKENKQLMAWPMAVAGEEVAGNTEKVYKTRLLEPPADFHNIRVSMQK